MINRARDTRPWHLYALAVVAVAITVLAVAQIGAPTSSARTSTQILTAEKGVIQSTVTGTGNVAAGTDLSLNFQTSGTLSKVYVKAGQHVTKGQLLAALDPSTAQLSLDQAQQNLTAAEDQLSTAETNSTSTTSATTTTAGLDLGSGTGTTEFVSATSTVPSTTTTTTTPKSQATTTTTPAPKTTQTTTTTTSKTTPAPTAATPSAGGGSTGSGSAGSGSTGTGSSSGTTSPAGTVASAQAAVYSAEASVKTATTALAATKLYAPISGTIVSLANLSPGDSVSSGSTSSASGSTTSSSGSSSTSTTGGSAGTTAGSLGGSSSSTSSSSASSTSPFVEIVNTGSMTMTVALSESDVSKVKVGQPATVTVDALAGVELGAHLTAISTVGTTSSSVVSYNATLTLNQSDSRVKPGMSASASIIVGQAQGVNVPNSAVTGNGSVATVTLDQNGKKTQRQVAIGLRGDSRTQIVSGLNAGDQLAVTTTLPPLTSATSTTSSTGSGTLGGTTVRPGGPGGGGGFGGGGGGGGARGASGAGAAG
jgi:multidrug efflux pump subunit AcrA (membrane-fusion protein)